MDNANYITLSRQSGLMRELSIIANNIANADTNGYKSEGAVFSEYIMAAKQGGNAASPRNSLSMGRLAAHASDFATGELRSTGGSLDIAIDGTGFFLVDVDGETQLTRAGHFMTNDEGLLINADGHAVLGEGEGEIRIPLEATQIIISKDGTMSADGVEIGRLGVVNASEISLSRAGSNNWIPTDGFEPLENVNVVQGFLEGSNVQPVAEIARMIEVQRHYDAGQRLLEMEDSRIKQVITTIRQIA